MKMLLHYCIDSMHGMSGLSDGLSLVRKTQRMCARIRSCGHLQGLIASKEILSSEPGSRASPSTSACCACAKDDRPATAIHTWFSWIQKWQKSIASSSPAKMPNSKAYRHG